MVLFIHNTVTLQDAINQSIGKQIQKRIGGPGGGAHIRVQKMCCMHADF